MTGWYNHSVFSPLHVSCMACKLYEKYRNKVKMPETGKSFPEFYDLTTLIPSIEYRNKYSSVIKEIFELLSNGSGKLFYLDKRKKPIIKEYFKPYTAKLTARKGIQIYQTFQPNVKSVALENILPQLK